jgi:hypothetical protein
MSADGLSDLVAVTQTRPTQTMRPSHCAARRHALWVSGLTLMGWALTQPDLHDAEGDLSGRACLPIAAGVAALVLAWAGRGPWRRFAGWFAVALIGQAVALQLVQAGPVLRYQHYAPLTGELSGAHVLLLVCLAAQLTLVVVGLTRQRFIILASARRTFKVWQLVCVVLVLATVSAVPSRIIPAYGAELAFATLVQLVSLGNLVLMMLSVPGGTVQVAGRGMSSWFKVFDSPTTPAAGRPIGLDRFAALAAAWVVLFTAALAVLVYQRQPHLADEVAYLYQARLFADGAATTAAPPAPAGFELYLFELDGSRWYPTTPPGWAALLAVGVRLGVPWLVDPVLAGFNVLLAYLLLGELYDRRTARIAVLLLCASPWALYMGMNFMTHTSTLTCALVGSVAVTRARRTGRSAWGWLAGAAAGLASLIRPLDGLTIAALLGVWAIGIGGSRLRLPALAGLVLGCGIVAAAVLPFDQLLTGHATTFPLMAYTDKHFGVNSNALGFGPDRGLGWPLVPFPGHSPLGSAVNALLNAASLNVELFGWSAGSLLFVALLVAGRGLRKPDYLMLAAIAATFGVHIFYWFSGGPDFGPRYWFLMLVPCIALTARGVQFLSGSSLGGARVLASVAALSMVTLISFIPWRALDKYHHYLGMRPDLAALAEQHDFGRSLVLIRGDEQPDYASAAIYNPIDFHADVPVYARERDPRVRAELVQAYADRPIWIVVGPTITHGPFEIVAGPLSGTDVLGSL